MTIYQTSMNSLQTARRAFAHIGMCVHMFMRVFMYTCMSVCMCAYACVCVCACVCLHVLFYAYVCSCICLFMHSQVVNAIPCAFKNGYFSSIYALGNPNSLSIITIETMDCMV